MILMLQFPFRPAEVVLNLLQHPLWGFLLVQALLWGINFWINMTQTKMVISPWYLAVVLFVPLMIWLCQIVLRADGIKVSFVDLLKIHAAPGLVLAVVSRLIAGLQDMVPVLTSVSRLLDIAFLIWFVYMGASAVAVVTQQPVRKTLWSLSKAYLFLLLAPSLIGIIGWLIWVVIPK